MPKTGYIQKIRLRDGVGDFQAAWRHAGAAEGERNVAFTRKTAIGLSRPPESTTFLPLRMELLS
jgi:hypothetical protein